VDAGVADAEAFADDAAEIDLTGDGAVADHVAGDDVLFGLEGAGLWWIGDDAPAGKAFAAVVIGVAFALWSHAFGQEASEALAGVVGEFEVDGLVGQAGKTVLLGDHAGERGADGAIDVVDGDFGVDLFGSLERRLGEFDELGHVQRLLQAVI